MSFTLPTNALPSVSKPGSLKSGNPLPVEITDSQTFCIPPQPAAALDVPQGNNTVTLQAIDTTANMVCDASSFVEPVIPGHEKLNFKTLCFLIENKAKNQHVLFDCGARKDYWNGAPTTIGMITGSVPGLRVEQGVDEILVTSGFDLKNLNATIWSHWHWDHIGDGSKFPSSMDIVVGPGFKKNFLPGYPENPKGKVLASDLAGHEIREISFDSNFKIGKFNAHDFFGDGSFYLLDVPGHAIGHMCGLARTTSTTFAFLGGDCCHFAGSFRPTVHMPLPAYIPGSALDLYYPHPCPSSMFTMHHPSLKGAAADDQSGELNARTKPFYKISRNSGGAYTFREIAQQSIDNLQSFDADPDVFVCLAHDGALFDALPLFNHDSKSHICDWKEKGYKDKSKWGFLNELPKGSKPGREVLVAGWHGDEKMINEMRLSSNSRS